MGSLMKSDRNAAKKKGTWALVTTAAGVALSVAATPWLGVPVAGVGLYLGYDWFMYRAKRGMRF